MIGFKDAGLIALAKLRAHKIRAGITIFTSALLFSTLLCISMVASGIFTSINKFSGHGLSSRYIVQAFNINLYDAYDTVTKDKNTKAKLDKLHEDLIKEKQLAAKELGIPYDKSTEEKPYQSNPSDKSITLAEGHPLVEKLFTDYFKDNPGPGIEELIELSKDYNPKKTMQAEVIWPHNGDLKDMRDGKEDLRQISTAQNREQDQKDEYEPPIIRGSLMKAPDDIIAPYYLHDLKWDPEQKEIPIMLQQKAIERILKLEPLSPTATQTERLNRIKTVRERASETTFNVCYRNTASIALLQNAVQIDQEIKSNKNKSDYVKPEVIYNLPADKACAAPTIKTDTRDELKKNLDEKLLEFEKRFNKHAEPKQQKITFKVVGILPGIAAERTTTIEMLLAGLIGEQTYSAAIPEKLLNEMPPKNRKTDILTLQANGVFGGPEASKHLYVEFYSAQDAIRFMKDNNCNQTPESCDPKARPFASSLFGSNSAALSEVRDRFTSIFKALILAVITLAALIMTLTIGRLLSDSRKETAVFRAIGFKRSDITAIYGVYTVLIATFTATLTFAIGTLLAYLLHSRFHEGLTIQSLIAFGSPNLNEKFNILGFDPEQIALILLAIIITGLISMIIPLARNIRRNPINDMRDE